MEENTPIANPTPVNENKDDTKKDLFKKARHFAWEFLKIVFIAAIIVLPIRYFLFQPFIVKGDSMVPNYHSGDYLIVDEISYRFASPQRGDAIVLKYPLDTTQRFIKRIIGLPGETIEVKNGKVTITPVNGQPFLLDEKQYLPDLLGTDGNIKVTLKSQEYFVMGDNRPFSYDSRRWVNMQGQYEPVVPASDIIGKAVLRVFPLSSLGYLGTPKY